MATTLTITPQTTSISATSEVTTLTISTAVAGLATDAQGVSFSGAARTISGADNVQEALLELADQLWVQTTAPTAGTTNLAEGDFFYDTDDNQLKIYREISTGTFSWVPVMIGNTSADSDTIDAGSF